MSRNTLKTVAVLNRSFLLSCSTLFCSFASQLLQACNRDTQTISSFSQPCLLRASNGPHRPSRLGVFHKLLDFCGSFDEFSPVKHRKKRFVLWLLT